MPHSTRSRSQSPTRRKSDMTISSPRVSMEPFPDIDPTITVNSNFSQPQNGVNSIGGSGQPPLERWAPRRTRGVSWANGQALGGRNRQASLSDAFRNLRTRKGSVSANMQEIGDALKAPVSPVLVTLCIIWYLSSALTNTSSKSILNAFPKPATLTLIQFAFVAAFCMFLSWLSAIFPILKEKVPALRPPIRPPSKEVLIATLPLAFFQIGGHLLSSTATAKIPVSLVHTIKGLSPLITVFAYRILFNIRYPSSTYLSLIPLTLGVMLACSADFKGNIFGIFYAFLATLIFVSQNIFSKKLFNEAAIAEAAGITKQTKKLDKLNLLCYSSGAAFLLTAPIWFWSEGITLIGDFLHDGALDLETHPEAFDHGRLLLEFIFNGSFHFSQNLLAFILLSMVSPVTYSVASLIKRVFVVVVAIVWFQNSTTKIQALGIALTFFGLYLYDRSNDHSKADRKARMLDIKEESILPTINTRPTMISNGPIYESPHTSSPHPYTNGYALNSSAVTGDTKKSDDSTPRGRARGASTVAGWLPPGTKQEETWLPRSTNISVGQQNGNGYYALPS